ncbi:MAG: TAXI family TRAP transporter solute-binding subunit [Pseudomonadota bacterium]
MRKFLLTATAALGGVALALAVGYLASLPTTLKVQVPSHDTSSRKLFDTAAEHFKAKRLPIRLDVSSAPSSAAALTALEKGETDLAVARAEDLIKTKAQTALILREEGAVIMAPKTGKVKKFADIIGANLGVVREGPASTGAFQALMNYYALDPSKIKPVLLQPADVGVALRDKKVDALIVVGNPNSKYMADIVIDASRNARGGIKFLDIEAAEAIAKRVPELESIEIKQGLFGGTPPLPTEEIKTVGYTIRLAASDKLSDDRVADLIRQMINARQNLGAVAPGAAQIKTPDTDDETTFVIHPGVMNYGTGELKTFFDRYGDWLYIGLFLASGIGSAFAGAFSWFNSQRRARTMARVHEIEKLADAATEAKSTEELDEIEKQVQGVFAFALDQAIHEKLDEANLNTFKFALDEARNRIERRRVALASAQSEPSGQLVSFKPASSPQAS